MRLNLLFHKLKNNLLSLVLDWNLPFQEKIYTGKKALTSFLSLLVLTALMITDIKAQDVLVGLTSNGGSAGKGTVFSIKATGTNFSVLKGFADWGQTPNGDLLFGSDGNFYGMTSTGGTYTSTGAIFKMSSTGTVTILKQFNNTSDGYYPNGELIKGSDGNFYGLTTSGGPNSYGTIFKLTPAGVYTVLRSFNYSADGAGPRGHLVLAKDGNFYGITRTGGTYGYGTIFKITAAGAYTVLRSLNNTTDGGNSYGSLTEGTDGNLYGITYSGGTYSAGTAFKITTAGTFTVIHNFNEATEGGSSESDLIRATDGNFYSMCYRGGTNSNGTIFKMTTAGTLTVLRHLSAGKDGGYPYGNLFQNSDGVLYGMMTAGGANSYGTIFKITTAGAYTVLHSFVLATEGGTPNGSLIKGADGNFYGLTSSGGSLKGGTAFKVTTAGAVTVLASFNGASIGNAPYETLVKSKDSAYYGTTSSGGKYGYGTIFKICGGTTSLLYSFNSNSDGSAPKGSLIQATDGNFYGMTTQGGSYSAGTIFKISAGGTFTVLRHLSSSTDGGSPQGSLMQAKDSFLYGMTNTGGTNGGGTIFKISTAGSFTVLRHLSYSTDGNNPEGNLIQGTDGNLYGMTSSSAHIFKITTAGAFTSLHTLTTAEGNYPLGSLVQAKDGNFYGTTSSGGTYGYGTIFKMTTAGVVTVLRQLNPTTDGKVPKGNLLQGTDGNLYGMTSAGGTNNVGTLFKITTAGSYTVLRQFDITTDGGSPYGSLIIAPVNSLVANAQSVTTTEDTNKPITLSGSGGSSLSYTISSKPLHGTITGTGANVTYTPSANYSGKDSFYFTVNVGCLASAPAKVNITVTAVNDAPVLAAIGNKNVIVNATLAFTATATDPDAGQIYTYSLISAPAGATINTSTGAFSWKPTTAGTFTFKVRVTDNGSPVLYDEEQITVTVTPSLAPEPPGGGGKHWVKLLKAILCHNPVFDNIILTWNYQAKQATITIVNEAGVVIYTHKFNVNGSNRLEIPAVQLKRGIYFLKLQTEQNTQTLRFIKL